MTTRINNNKMIRNYVMAGLLLLCTVTGYSQSVTSSDTITKEVTKMEGMSIAVTVDSAEDLKSSFKAEDIIEILGDLSEDQTISFKLICNGEKMSNGVKSHLSYKIDGNSNDTDDFL